MEMFDIWCEKWRPKLFDDIILEPHIKNPIKKYIDNKELANFLFHGVQGIGKTSLAKLLPIILDKEFIFINSSLENSLDILRTTVTQFVQSVSFKEGKKVVILDEIDSTNNSNFLPALRPFIEKYNNNAIFIATCNNINLIPAPIMSRFQDFNFNVVDRKWYAKQILNTILKILNEQKVKYKISVLAQIIQKYFPDIRKIIQFCQQYQLELENDNILYKITKGRVDELFKYLKSKDFGKVRELILSEWSNIDSIYRELYESIKDFLDPNCIPQIILILSDYGKWHQLCVDKEIHITACLLEVSNNARFK